MARRLRSCIAALALAVAASQGSARASAEADRQEATLAQELMRVEMRARALPASSSELLDQILLDAEAAASKVNRHPDTREQALAVLEAVQIALARHNLVQPGEEKDWTQTMGDALTPLKLTANSRAQILESGLNTRRAQYVSPGRPLYFVDCDMGAQLFVSVGQRLGWDIRLVGVEKHNFVRWHLPNHELVNWDWTRWGSRPDSEYSAGSSPRQHSIYLRSLSPEEARAYYLGLIASKTPSATVAEALFEEARNSFPGEPVLLNNIGWFYATHPGVPASKRAKALTYALDAWSFDPVSANKADTVACAFAARGRFALGVAVEDYALAYANERELAALNANRSRMEQQRLCNP